MSADLNRVRQDMDAQILKAAVALGISGNGRGAHRIMALLCSPTVSATEIAALISREPDLSLRVLRVANTAFYGVARNVSTVERALVLLGLDAVRGIAAAACLDRTIRSSGHAGPIDADALIRHSLATAVAAEALARIRHCSLAPEAFIAGLLHNFGITVQRRLDPGGVKAMIDALRAEPDRNPPALEAELAKVGHEQCAAVLFEAWQLPAMLVEAARHHHEPMAAPEKHRELAALVNLGIHLSLACGNTYALEPAATPRDHAVMTLLGLTDEDVDRVAADLPERLAKLQQAFAAG